MTQTAMRSTRPVIDPAEERLIHQNLGLLEEFIQDFDAACEPPKGSTLILLPDDDPELTAANIRLGLHVLEEGANVYFRHVHRKDQ